MPTGLCGIRVIFFTRIDRKSTRLNSSHVRTSYAVFCLKKKKARPRSTRPSWSRTTRPPSTRSIGPRPPPPRASTSLLSPSPRPPTPTLFPYTTLFRSQTETASEDGEVNFGAIPEGDFQLSVYADGFVRHTRHLLHAYRSEEHTSELQSRPHLVCRLLLEKKKGKASFDETKLVENYAAALDAIYRSKTATATGKYLFIVTVTPTTDTYTLSLHDALPISNRNCV